MNNPYQSPTSDVHPSAKALPIKGWMWAIAVAILVTFLFQLILVAAGISKTLDNTVNPVLKEYFYVVWGSGMVLVFGSAIQTLLFIKKDYRFPKVFVLMFSLTIFTILALLAWRAQLTGSSSFNAGEAAGRQIGLPLFVGIAACWYVLRSKQAKATFIRRPTKR